jgi:hypothetical protein
VIQLRHEQPSLWHAGLAKDIEDLWEPWMREADRLLEDVALVESVYEAQGKRIRDRMRTVKKRVLAIALAGRQPGPQREERCRFLFSAKRKKDSGNGSRARGHS